MREVLKRILRCVPDAGSGETVSPHEVAQRLGLSRAAVEKALSRAVQRGEVVRVRQGAYQTKGATT